MTHARNLSINDYMSSTLLTADHRESIAAARERLLKSGVGLLPVLEAGRVVGVLAQRHVVLTEGLSAGALERLTVAAFMEREFYAVGPDHPVDVTAREMAHHKHHAALVVEAERLLGVFTTTDALRALSDSLTDSLPGNGTFD